MRDIFDALKRVERLRHDIPAYVSSADDSSLINRGTGEPLHPFDVRNFHEALKAKPQRLFDNGHYPEATFEATKILEERVRKWADLKSKSGMALMMDAFAEDRPKIALNSLIDQSDRDEQAGFKYIFAGTMGGIRNPRGHKSNMDETPDDCLDHLGIISLLLRRLDMASKRTSGPTSPFSPPSSNSSPPDRADPLA